MTKHGICSLMVDSKNLLAMHFHRSVDGGDVNGILKIHVINYFKIELKEKIVL